MIDDDKKTTVIMYCSPSGENHFYELFKTIIEIENSHDKTKTTVSLIAKEIDEERINCSYDNAEILDEFKKYEPEKLEEFKVNICDCGNVITGKWQKCKRCRKKGIY